MTAKPCEFKPGDRVRIYGCNTKNMISTGVITKAFRDVWFVKHDANPNSEQTYHPKQLRRLKPRPKEPVREAREWMLKYSPGAKQWVEAYPRSGHIAFPDQDNVKVREVLPSAPNTVTVSREKLESAWVIGHGSDRASKEEFDSFCEELGLKESAES